MRNYRTTICVGVLCGAIIAPGRMGSAAELVRIDESNYEQVVPPGKEVDAIIGDYVLRNAHVSAVIAQPVAGRQANMTVRGVAGMLVDFTRRQHGSDQLSCFYPGAGRYLFEQTDGMQCTIDDYAIDLEGSNQWSGKSITLTFAGTSVAEDGTTAELNWTLADGQPHLKYSLKLSNQGTTPRDVPIESSLRCDGQSFKGNIDEELKLFVIDDLYFGQCYGFMLDEGTISSEGEGRKLRLKSAGQVAGKDKSTIEAGESVIWSGAVTCAQGVPSIRCWALGQLEQLAAESTELKLQSPTGPVARAEVEFIRNEKSLGKVLSDEDGVVRSDLLPGEYKLWVRSTGREPREHAFAVDHGQKRADTLSLPEASRVRSQITDGLGEPIAAKVQFIGLDGTRDPDFGPDSAAEAVRNVVYCADGKFERDIGAGRYKAIISHGPEYDAVMVEIDVAAGRLVRLETQLIRTVDTTGWISADFHSHSSPSGDNVSTQRGRVLNLLAEHIEFAPCTEHNRIDTYADDLDALRVNHAMATCTGMELTGSPLPINHQNAFPLHRHEHVQDGGGPVTDFDPVKQIERLALWDNASPKVVQTNHPNIPQILGDADLDGVPDNGFRGMLGWMDVIEVHPPEGIFSTPDANSKSQDKYQNAIFFWMQLLNLGYRIPGVVNTDAHANYHGSGWLRNYLASSSDLPAKITIDDMIHSAEHGHVVMTTGPYLETQLRVEHADHSATYISGEDVRLFPAQDAVAKMWIRVQCPNWFDVNRVQIFANGRPLDGYNFTRRSQPQQFSSESVRFECEVELPKFEQDTHLIVATIGEGLTLGPVMGPDRGKLPPVAVANPIFVDIDGSGFQANGDDLGYPFMLPALAP